MESQQRDLPHDLIIQNILIRLPIKPILRFKSVSKLWYSSLSSPRFAYTHFKFAHTFPPTEGLLVRSGEKFQLLSYENGDSRVQIASECKMNLVDTEVDFDAVNEKLVLVGSCNGLVCLAFTSSCLFILWNPITRKYCKYSDFEDRFLGNHIDYMVTWGFGYVSTVDDYKVVRICKRRSSQSIIVHVFSFRLNKWRRIDNDSSQNFSDLRVTERLFRPGLLVNETLYWMHGAPLSMIDSYSYQRKILVFDLALELFDTFPHLDVRTRSAWLTGEECLDEFLCVIQGCLSKYSRFVRTGAGVITMLKHPGEKEQILLSTDLVGSMSKNLIGFTGCDKFFTLYYGSHAPRIGIIDPSLRPMTYTTLMTLSRMSKIEIASYSPTLISPIAMTGDD